MCWTSGAHNRCQCLFLVRLESCVCQAAFTPRCPAHHVQPNPSLHCCCGNTPLAVQDGERRAPGREQDWVREQDASDRGALAGGEAQGGRTGGACSRALGAPNRVDPRTWSGSASVAGLPSGDSLRPTETPSLATIDAGRRSRDRSPQHTGQVRDRREGQGCLAQTKSALTALATQLNHSLQSVIQ